MLAWIWSTDEGAFSVVLSVCYFLMCMKCLLFPINHDSLSHTHTHAWHSPFSSWAIFLFLFFPFFLHFIYSFSVFVAFFSSSFFLILSICLFATQSDTGTFTRTRKHTHTHTHTAVSVLVACSCLPRPDIKAGALPGLWFLVDMVAAQPVWWSLVNLTHQWGAVHFVLSVQYSSGSSITLHLADEANNLSKVQVLLKPVSNSILFY